MIFRQVQKFFIGGTSLSYEKSAATFVDVKAIELFNCIDLIKTDIFDKTFQNN